MGETKAMSLKNIQKQHQIIKNKYNDIKHLNEQYIMTMDAKNEFIQQLKEQNENLENLNEETMKINHDLRHELEQRMDEKKSKLKRIESNNKVQKTEIVFDRHSFDDEDDDDYEEEDIHIKNEQVRRSSVPSSIYAQNLDLIVKSVNKDEYTFLEDLSVERSTLKPTTIRSTMLKHCHNDAEKEFFFMMVLTVKLEISIKNGITNAILSDVSPQTL